MSASIPLKVARYLTLPADIECGFGAGSEFACCKACRTAARRANLAAEDRRRVADREPHEPERSQP